MKQLAWKKISEYSWEKKIVRQIGYISSSTKTCRGSREISSILQENKSGDFYFYCFNNLIELKENAREKMEKS